MDHSLDVLIWSISGVGTVAGLLAVWWLMSYTPDPGGDASEEDL